MNYGNVIELIQANIARKHEHFIYVVILMS